jgi:hypothetical protein
VRRTASSISPGHLAIELAQPRPLTVPGGPDDGRVAQVMQLHPPVAGARPHIRQGPAKLGVPPQRRQVIDDDRHAHMIDRAVGCHLDRQVGYRAPAEQPHITRARQIHGLIKGDAHSGHDLT